MHKSDLQSIPKEIKLENMEKYNKKGSIWSHIEATNRRQNLVGGLFLKNYKRNSAEHTLIYISELQLYMLNVTFIKA